MTSNMTHDAYGREWADHSKMRPGTSRVTHDGGARCLPTGETFEEELARREADAAQNDQRIQSKDLTEMLTDPGESEDDELELG